MDHRSGVIEAVSINPRHGFSKSNQLSIRLIEGRGVEGDAHMGEKVRHRFHRRYRPHLDNLRQVHLMHAELFDELKAAGFQVAPGDLGENITTRGLDILALPTGTLLRLGSEAVVELTGVRNPCVQIDRFQEGLLAQMIEREPDGTKRLKSGVMSVVITGGEVKPGDQIVVGLPAEPHQALTAV
jgi:MOSC domain-containing protein YiiM